jgi:hypothetical protein
LRDNREVALLFIAPSSWAWWESLLFISLLIPLVLILRVNGIGKIEPRKYPNNDLVGVAMVTILFLGALVSMLIAMAVVSTGRHFMLAITPLYAFSALGWLINKWANWQYRPKVGRRHEDSGP